MSSRAASLIFFTVILGSIMISCGGSTSTDQNGTGQVEDVGGSIEWKILPQFPPRSQVISRRLLGINDLTMIDSNTGWVVGTDGAIGRTSDGGDTFVLQKTGVSINLTAVSFPDAQNGRIHSSDP